MNVYAGNAFDHDLMADLNVWGVIHGRGLSGSPPAASHPIFGLNLCATTNPQATALYGVSGDSWYQLTEYSDGTGDVVSRVLTKQFGAEGEYH